MSSLCYDARQATGISVSHSGWGEALEGFTCRNWGKHVTIHADTPALSEYPDDHDFPLECVIYAPGLDRVHILLGDESEPDRWSTRTIADVSSLELLKDSEGEDTGLRILHGAEQTTVMLRER